MPRHYVYEVPNKALYEYNGKKEIIISEHMTRVCLDEFFNEKGY